MALEIERKFLCTLTREEAIKLCFSSRSVKSIYLQNTKEASTRVVKDTFEDGRVIAKWTQKTSTGDLLVRTELEDVMPSLVFDSLDDGTYPTVSKHRYLIDVNGSTWEVDFFDNYDFVIAELEFENKETALNFTDFPSWIGEEVTNDPSYLNCNLAARNFSWIKLH